MFYTPTDIFILDMCDIDLGSVKTILKLPNYLIYNNCINKILNDLKKSDCSIVTIPYKVKTKVKDCDNIPTYTPVVSVNNKLFPPIIIPVNKQIAYFIEPISLSIPNSFINNKLKREREVKYIFKASPL